MCCSQHHGRAAICVRGGAKWHWHLPRCRERAGGSPSDQACEFTQELGIATCRMFTNVPCFVAVLAAASCAAHHSCCKPCSFVAHACRGGRGGAIVRCLCTSAAGCVGFHGGRAATATTTVQHETHHHQSSEHPNRSRRWHQCRNRLAAPPEADQNHRQPGHCPWRAGMSLCRCQCW